MVTLRVNITTTGKLFTQDQGPVIARMTSNIIRELAQKGESRLDEVLRPRPAGVYLSIAEAQRGHGSTGHFRRSVNTLHGPRSSTIQSDVVYGPWLEGDSARNATTRFKGYQSFRKTAQWLVKQANTIMTKHVNAFIRDIN